MAAQSCLVLIEASRGSRPTARIIPVPDNHDSQAFVKAIRDVFLESLGSMSKSKRFFSRYVLLKRAVISVATLRQIDVDLTALPASDALVQSAYRDKALTEAFHHPDSTDDVFFRQGLRLHGDWLAEMDQHDVLCVLPKQALLIREETHPNARRVLAGLASLVGWGVVIGLRLVEIS